MERTHKLIGEVIIMIEKKINNTLFLQFENFQQFPEINHFVSTRQGGISPAPYCSLNLGLKTKDETQNVLENRNRLASATGIALEDCCFAKQVHENTVVILDINDKGKGSKNFEDSIANCDAMITKTQGICPVVMAADCVPLLIYDPVQKVAGAVHSGWRGTVKKIIFHTIKAMQEKFSSNTWDLWVGIGPCIHPGVYEVGNEVVEKFREEFKEIDSFFWGLNSNKSKHLDLVEANRYMLRKMGVPLEQVEVMNICTYRNPDLCFSARRDGINSGRFVAGIMLK